MLEQIVGYGGGGLEARALAERDFFKIWTVVEQVVGQGLEVLASIQIDPLEIGVDISDRDGRHIFTETQFQFRHIRVWLLSSTD